MPGIAGQVVILAISDADQSAAWYRELLGSHAHLPRSRQHPAGVLLGGSQVLTAVSADGGSLPLPCGHRANS
jgi:hypothetical protein